MLLGNKMYKNNLNFKQAIITEEIYENIKDDIRTWAKKADVQFISIKKTGNFDFIHVTVPDLWEKIEREGLVTQENSKGDLGKGIYTIPLYGDSSIEARINLEDYLTEYYDQNEEILIVEGSYSGEYQECVYGHCHKGYRVLLVDQVTPMSITNMEILPLEEFISA